MEAKIPLSVVYIAMGSILANICGYQKITKTKPIMDTTTTPHTQTRVPLHIIYDSYDNLTILPGKISPSFSQTDNALTPPVTDSACYIAEPHYTNTFDSNWQWYFPKIPVIDGKEHNFKGLFVDKLGDDTYDYLYLKGQHPINNLNAGEIFFYTSQDSFIKWTHIGNYQSPLIMESASPVYGFGLSNLETDRTKTVEIEDGSIHLDYRPTQLKFKTLTTSQLRNFNIDPRNTYFDKVHIPYMIVEFLIKRIS